MADETEYIKVKVVLTPTWLKEVLQDYEEIHFRVKQTTKMGKLKKSYRERLWLPVTSLRLSIPRSLRMLLFYLKERRNQRRPLTYWSHPKRRHLKRRQRLRTTMKKRLRTSMKRRLRTTMRMTLSTATRRSRRSSRRIA